MSNCSSRHGINIYLFADTLSQIGHGNCEVMMRPSHPYFHLSVWTRTAGLRSELRHRTRLHAQGLHAGGIQPQTYFRGAQHTLSAQTEHFNISTITVATIVRLDHEKQNELCLFSMKFVVRKYLPVPTTKFHFDERKTATTTKKKLHHIFKPSMANNVMRAGHSIAVLCAMRIRCRTVPYA